MRYIKLTQDKQAIVDDEDYDYLMQWKWHTDHMGNCWYASRTDNKQRCQIRMHHVILNRFVGLCPEGMEACHNNGNTADNRIENLRWDTRSNNHKDAVRHGTLTTLFQPGEKHWNAKLSKKDVEDIKHLYYVLEFSRKRLAEIFKVSRPTVSRILMNKRWK